VAIAVDALFFCTHLVDRYASVTLGRQLGKIFVGDLWQELFYSVQPRAKKEAIPQITKGILPAVAAGAIRPPLERRPQAYFSPIR
jgi:hypothetical protein